MGFFSLFTNTLRFWPGGVLGRSCCETPLGHRDLTPSLLCCPILRWVKQGDGYDGFVNSIPWPAVSGCKLPSIDGQREGTGWCALEKRCFSTYSLLTWLLLPIFKPCQIALLPFLQTHEEQKESYEYVMLLLLGKQNKQWETSQSPPQQQDRPSWAMWSFFPATATKHGPQHLLRSWTVHSDLWTKWQEALRVSKDSTKTGTENKQRGFLTKESPCSRKQSTPWSLENSTYLPTPMKFLSILGKKVI